MRRVRACFGVGPALLLAMVACTPLSAARPDDWRTRITDRDRERLHNWRHAWRIALDRATNSGARARIAAEGALLAPDAAIAGGGPPDGEYRCRVIKLGAQAAGGLDYVAYPAFRCRLADGRFAKLDGSQRPVGRIQPYDDARQLFLGTVVLGDETTAMPYGRDPDRDMVGLLERIGPRRWRLVLPAPRWESLLDVIELVPAG